MNLNLVLLLSLMYALFLVGCGEPAKHVNAQSGKKEELISLKNTFNDDFYIGAALNRAQIEERIPEVVALLPKEFNSITAENMMKWMYIHPGPDSFQFTMADQFVELGEQSDMFIVGHTLVWHSQLAPWVQEVKDGAELMNHLENHIKRIVSRYKGKVDGWDVVNEALNEDGTLRESIFLDLIGKDYLQKAFALTSAIDPEAELYYNDYNLVQYKKRKGAIQLIKDIQASGVKIDGVGIQAHWGLDHPSLETIDTSIREYAELGIKVMFTELDINVIPNPWDLEGADVNQNFEGSEKMNPYPDLLPDSIQNQLAERYRDIFDLFLKHKDNISRVTFWGVDDGQSWKNNWPIKGRTDYPLLFDRDYKPKKAYHSIIALKSVKD